MNQQQTQTPQAQPSNRISLPSIRFPDNLDIDRITEDKEDFLKWNGRRKLAINKMTLKPQYSNLNLLSRSIVGGEKIFKEG